MNHVTISLYVYKSYDRFVVYGCVKSRQEIHVSNWSARLGRSMRIRRSRYSLHLLWGFEESLPLLVFWLKVRVLDTTFNSVNICVLVETEVKCCIQHHFGSFGDVTTPSCMYASERHIISQKLHQKHRSTIYFNVECVAFADPLLGLKK